MRHDDRRIVGHIFFVHNASKIVGITTACSFLTISVYSTFVCWIGVSWSGCPIVKLYYRQFVDLIMLHPHSDH